MLKLFNTLTKEKQKFIPLKNNKVKMYTCGPTIYDFAHIGNMSSYLFADVLKRYLRFCGYKVKDVMNLTDVDDKTIKATQIAGEELRDFTKKFELALYEDFNALNIEKPKKVVRATNYIQEMISLIKKLEKLGYAYQTSDKSVYFRISKFENYGQLANLEKQQLKTDADGRTNSDEYDKENAQDFALWKAWDKADGNIKWDSPWGPGRPGWHIECSAMIMKLLGEQIDIHTGGEDLIFPHHQNEIAQTEAVTGKQFVQFWLHRAFLKVDGKKMSKSIGNFYTLQDILQKVPNPLAFRFLIITNHYKQPLNFTIESLESANSSLNKIHNFINRLKNLSEDQIDNDENLNLIQEQTDKAYQTFSESMDDDLNTPKAIAGLFEFITMINRFIDEKRVGKYSKKQLLKFLTYLDSVWGFIFFDKQLEVNIAEQIEQLILKRNIFRQEKNYQEADKVRSELLELGVEIKDEGDKTTWTYLK
ncbi:cysteine--tRNA ligase [Candidatus Falkowbacteria bacterium RIFOXYD2_FULL_35_9]|uniref:Cysteine--tRNA ligase n=1 Tax=Candidatus Falkowbacteria bacterium RIFOXYC2_FULL_36_12 TaxID=1798002 RepID=A0A1F5T0A0_9BACT|nr:MAG: cysteine--tRNA ligase [Candidatus Falkowbacteria bacterium RIFOXYB2_FULL_35_7]OGF32342.1 MAG: cysteine--tRNA ligase [Candidatus Falkowbacteria bacterium RIFOXYC2_FULL_36_12]OGF47260.1 MAG: cysteine--tRNA ligase [Candidatus Falkowbacteria bacterium RIFOXYD2_FULL_35_9]